MALNLETKYGARANAADADYPYGSIKDKVGGAADTGTPVEADIMNDFVGLGQKLLDEAGIVPSNAPDNVTSSQYYNAMTTIFPTKAELAAAPGDLAPGITAFGADLQNSPFGRTGLRLAAGEKRDAHYGWGSIVEIPDSNKWVMIYRKGSTHGTEDGAECRTADSYDYGISWINDRLVHAEVDSDARADRIALMANGRIGFFCNRASTGTNKYPLFISSDDAGVTWNKLTVPTSSLTYTFSAVGGIVDFPLSQGGNDTTGFVSFGYIDGTGIDAFTTTNNGDTWSTVSNVNGSTVVSENVIIRLGTSDRWLIFVRASPNLLVYATTNILSWGTSLDTGLENLSTPPGGYYDATTDKVYSFATARSGKEVDGYINNILYIGQDAETLWAASGVFTGSYKSLVTLPHWATGYISSFESSLGTCATVTAGENVASGLPPSSVWLIGNFETNGADIGMFVDKYTRNLREVNALRMQAVDNVTTNRPFQIENRSETARVELGAYQTYVNTGGGLYTYSYNNGTVLYAHNGPAECTYAAGVEIDTVGTSLCTFSGGAVTYSYNGGNVLYAYNTDVEFNANSKITFDFDGDVQFEGFNYWFQGITSNIDNSVATLHLAVNGTSVPAIRSQVSGTASSRKHYVFHHAVALPAAEVGSISTTATGTAYTTTSDETLKDFIGSYSGEDAINIIKSDPVREFTWKSTGEQAVGWGAQTSYAVSSDLATPGGWFLDDVEVPEGTAGAEYVQWGVDQSKRTPYLWAAVATLIDRVEELERKLNELGK